MLIQPVAVATKNREHSQAWVHGRVADVVLGWCWLPIALLMHSMESNVTRTQALMGIIFVISFAHQPLTLGLVYADPAQRAAHRRFYLFMPFLMLGLIVLGLNVSLTVVGLMAGLWNAEHTLMQRYGVLRIYGRKAGDDNGRIEKPMLIVWLVTALMFMGAYVNLPKMVAKIGFGGTNARSVKALESMRGVAMPLFWVGVAVSLWFAMRWVQAQRATAPSTARTAKWIYAAGTLGLLIAVMVDPIAGIAGYVAAHAIEYFGVVHGSLRRRAVTGEPSPLTSVSRSRPRRTALYVAYFAMIAALIVVSWNLWDGRGYAFLVLWFGGLHILYDGFVWKLRKPAVAASLGITPAAT